MDSIFSSVPSESPSPCPLEETLHAYAEYLEHDRGLAAETIRHSLRAAHDLVVECLGRGGLLWDQLHARDVTGFLLRYAERVRPSSAQVMASHLRRFLRYLHVQGALATDLACAVPSVADRGSPGRLPCRLEPEQVERLLASCDQTCARGQRDYAILLLLSRLGLRAGEVVALELSDIDWRAGVLSLRGKGPRRTRLPLPPDVGQALVTYLVEARPVCASQRVFLRWHPAVGGLSSSRAVSAIVRQALDRSGLAPKRKGAHLLRHSLATEMLRKGACLAEIAQILRHRSLAVTEIYARVDLKGLRELAQPWPGGDV